MDMVSQADETQYDCLFSPDIHFRTRPGSPLQRSLLQGMSITASGVNGRWQQSANVRQISNSTHIPWNSVALTFIITCLLSLIPLGSIIAFNIITSLSSIAIFSSYWISIACRLANRFSANPVKAPRWNLGEVPGTIVNCLALAFLTFGIAMLCFPAAPNPVPASFNWTVVIFSGVTILATIYYWAYGRKVYISPRSRLTHYGGAGTAELVEMGSDGSHTSHDNVVPDDKAFAA